MVWALLTATASALLLCTEPWPVAGSSQQPLLQVEHDPARPSPQHLLEAADDVREAEEALLALIGSDPIAVGTEEPSADEHSNWDAELLELMGKQGRRGSIGAGSRRTQVAWDVELENRLDLDTTTCLDELASNMDASGPCTYDCATLSEHFLPGRIVDRCFTYDATTQSWPQELLDLRAQRLDWHTYLEPTVPVGGTVIEFTIGDGPSCTNVTVLTESLATGEIIEDQFCLVDGRHEHDHILTDPHSVTVVGYNESSIRHEGPGGTTVFVVGECTDVVVRVVTTSISGTATFEINDVSWRPPCCTAQTLDTTSFCVIMLYVVV